jgi:hypothetical protein
MKLRILKSGDHYFVQESIIHLSVEDRVKDTWSTHITIINGITDDGHKNLESAKVHLLMLRDNELKRRALPPDEVIEEIEF